MPEIVHNDSYHNFYNFFACELLLLHAGLGFSQALDDGFHFHASGSFNQHCITRLEKIFQDLDRFLIILALPLIHAGAMGDSLYVLGQLTHSDQIVNLQVCCCCPYL
ncbi:MAG: hypothetical protein RQM92_03900 [Candidatus Syntrophopropionicum ammoniitolerans]